MRWIYCKKTTEVTFEKTEHVLPQSFGKFKSNLILRNIVCDSCNQFFGNEFEPKLARDSFEGLLRYDRKIKPSNDYKSLGKRSQLRIRLDEGELKGAYAYLTNDEDLGAIKVIPLPQIKVYDKTESTYKFILLSDLPPYSENYSKQFIIYGIDKTTAYDELHKKGWENIKFDSEVNVKEHKEDILCEIESVIDEKLKRCYVKIAFNYLAVNYETNELFEEIYDEVRNYVLQGTKVADLYIFPNNEDILSYEKLFDYKLNGHIINCEGDISSNRAVVNISLFNSTNYCIKFPKGSFKLIKNNFRGHFFNLSDFTLNEMIYQKKSWTSPNTVSPSLRDGDTKNVKRNSGRKGQKKFVKWR